MNKCTIIDGRSTSGLVIQRRYKYTKREKTYIYIYKDRENERERRARGGKYAVEGWVAFL